MRLLAGDKVKSMFDKQVLIAEATRSVRRSLKRGRQVQEVQDFGEVHDFGACLCGCSDHLWAADEKMAAAAWEIDTTKRAAAEKMAVAARERDSMKRRLVAATASWRRPPPTE